MHFGTAWTGAEEANLTLLSISIRRVMKNLEWGSNTGGEDQLPVESQREEPLKVTISTFKIGCLTESNGGTLILMRNLERQRLNI